MRAAASWAVAALAFATRRLANALSAYLLLIFPSGRLGLRRHRIAMAIVSVNAAIAATLRFMGVALP